MKCLLIYSCKTGKGKVVKKIPYIKKRLSLKYEQIDSKEFFSLPEQRNYIIANHQRYTDIIVCGGDGSIHNVINVLQENDIRINFSAIPFGTLNDGFRNYGYGRSVEKAIDIILQNKVEQIDLIKINNSYVFYMAAAGAYANLAALTKEKTKRAFSFFSYYFLSIKQMFKKQRYKIVINHNGIKSIREVPFILIANNKFIGGFKLNRHSLQNDGVAELLISKIGFTNGLINYFLVKRNIEQITFTNLEIFTSLTMDWYGDGEKIDSSERIKVSVTKSIFSVYYSAK